MALRKSRQGAGRESALAETAAFLGVVKSAKGHIWREQLDARLQNVAAAISQQHGLPELLGRVLAARGVTPDTTAVFLDPTLKALMPDPSSLRDMDVVARRLADAIKGREKIAIFGDYDVDGACSSALMARFLAHHGIEHRIYIPDRMTEGYGPNAEAIRALAAEGARVIVTVDCGTTSFDALGVARGLGVDVLVVDHHQADERLPDVMAVVNPNRQDDISGQGYLCAAGVVFLVLVALQRELRRRGFYAKGTPDYPLFGDLDLVALATVADVVPLIGLNRAYVTKGLSVMAQRENVGLRALQDAAGLSERPTTYHLGYILGPRINAGGRIGDAGLGAKLLSTHTDVEAARIAAILDRLNKERKAIEQQALEEAIGDCERQLMDDASLPLLVTGSEGWHKGIVGLIASRLVEKFRRPACVISWDKLGSGGGRVGTGSLRSVAGIDIGSVVRAAVGQGHLSKGGGHAMAAGLTIDGAKLSDLMAFFKTALAGSAGVLSGPSEYFVDGALTAQGVTEAFIDLVEKAGPYGQGNAQPKFVFPAHRVKFSKVVGDAHVRCVIEAGDGSRIDAVAFRAVGTPLGDLLVGTNGMPLHLAGSVKRDTWGGRNRLELLIDDAADPRQQQGR